MCVFFFQAEDGIRDLVRSRGLGDVYKRQGYVCIMIYSFRIYPNLLKVTQHFQYEKYGETYQQVLSLLTYNPVSYTHLTLPTSDLV